MSEVLSKPWLVASASKFLCGEDACPPLPQIVQLIQITERGKENELYIKISDKFNYITATIPSFALLDFEKKYQDRPLNDLLGALFRIESGHWIIFRDSNLSHLQLSISSFDYLGGEGCSVHGEPRNLCSIDSINILLKSWPSSQPNPDDLLHLAAIQTTDIFDPIPEEQESILGKTDFWETLQPLPKFTLIDYFDIISKHSNFKVDYKLWPR